MTCLFAWGFAVFNSHAIEVRQTPYGAIAARNLFQLHAPPTTPTPTPTPKVASKVHLTGITMILKRPVAFITIEGTKSQPEQSVILGEGDAANGVQVESIDQKAARVGILNDGESQVLNFELARPSGQQFIEATIMEVPMDNSRPSPRLTLPVQKNAEPSLSPEEQTALIELQRVKFQMEGNPAHSLLPPTGFDSNE